MDMETRARIEQLKRLCFTHHMRLIRASVSDGGNIEIGLDPSSTRRHAVLEDALQCHKCLALNGVADPNSGSEPETSGVGRGRVVALHRRLPRRARTLRVHARTRT